MIFMNPKHSKTIDPQKFVLNLSQTLDLRRLSKHIGLQNVLFNTHEKYKTVAQKQ